MPWLRSWPRCPSPSRRRSPSGCRPLSGLASGIGQFAKRERYLGCLPRTAAARALATALAAPGDLPDAAAALQQIIALNGGRRLAWRQLADLIDSTRPIGWRGH